jgi:hypothetical protein
MSWTVHEMPVSRRVIVADATAFFPVICVLTHLGFDREIVLHQAALIARVPDLLKENEELRARIAELEPQDR